MTTAISPTALKIIKAALTETNPHSIAEATMLTVQAVIANLGSLKKHNLATYDSEAKVLTLTPEGILLANTPDNYDDVPAPTIAAPTKPVAAAKPVTTPKPVAAAKPVAPAKPVAVPQIIEIKGSGTKKEKAWAIIEAVLAKAEAEGTEIDRPAIIENIITNLGVLKNNASQYYQNYRKAHGLVVPRVAKEEVAEGDKVADPIAATAEVKVESAVAETKDPDDVTSGIEDPTDV